MRVDLRRDDASAEAAGAGIGSRPWALRTMPMPWATGLASTSSIPRSVAGGFRSIGSAASSPASHSCSSPTRASVRSAAMQVTRFAEGLWRWSTHYGEWRAEVGSVYYEAPDAIVLIDPLAPPVDLAEVLEWLARAG